MSVPSPEMPDRFDAIKADLDLARRARALRVFGQEAHRFRLNPPLSEADLAAFESRHRDRLPADYRDFLLRVGNGGAGPYYGLFPLGLVDDGFSHMEWDEYSIGRLDAPFPHTEPWNDTSGSPDPALIDTDEAEYSRLLAAHEERYFSPRLMDGAIPICHLGCAIRLSLVITGAEAGHIWGDDRASDNGIAPLRSGGRARTGFFDWYRQWLDEVVSKIATTPRPGLLTRFREWLGARARG